jgi:ketosteroid isomerase-like protein
MQKLILYLIIIAAIVSCTRPLQNNSNNKKLVERYFDYFNKHQWNSMAAMYADTAIFKDPSFGTGMVKQTRQMTVEKYSALHKVFHDINDSVLHIYYSGDKQVIVEFISKATAPDSLKFELPVCTIFTIEHGKITKDFTYYDNF